MKAGNACTHCSAPIPQGGAFCRTCGMLFDAGTGYDMPVECEVHPGQRAIGVCVICSKPVCAACGNRSEGKMICSDPGHKGMLQEWCMLRQSESEFEAEAVLRNLADGGIETKLFSLHDHVTAHWLRERCVQLFVRTSEVEKAQALLQDLHLIDTDP